MCRTWTPLSKMLQAVFLCLMPHDLMHSYRRLSNFGSRSPTDQIAFLQDPFTCGAYSFNAVSCSSQHRLHLRSPVGLEGCPKRVHFAGEATSDRFPSTVHGAYLEGRRAAQEVADTARHEAQKRCGRKHIGYAFEEGILLE